MIDDTAAYYERHTRWRWSAGVGHVSDGRAVAWNLVEGVNDHRRAASGRCGSTAQPNEVGPCEFADLT